MMMMMTCEKILHKAKNAKYVQMFQKFQLLGDFVPQIPYRSFAPGPHWGTSDPPPSLLSGNESLCFSLRLCFNDACSVPNSWRTRNQSHGFMAG